MAKTSKKSSSNSSGTAGQQASLANLQAAQLAMQLQEQVRAAAFAKRRFEELEMPQFNHLTSMEKDRLALQQAQLEADTAYKQATMTGMYNGVPTMQAIQQTAQLTGTMPDGGKTYDRLLQEAKITGQYDGQETTDWKTQQANLTGYFDGQSTLSRQMQEAQLALNKQGQENQTALQLMQLYAQNRGAGNAFTQARLMGGTPNGFRDIINAVSGRFNLPGFGGGANIKPQAASLMDFVPGAANVQAPAPQMPGRMPPSGMTPPGSVGMEPPTTGPIDPSQMPGRMPPSGMTPPGRIPPPDGGRGTRGPVDQQTPPPIDWEKRGFPGPINSPQIVAGDWKYRGSGPFRYDPGSDDRFRQQQSDDRFRQQQEAEFQKQRLEQWNNDPNAPKLPPPPAWMQQDPGPYGWEWLSPEKQQEMAAYQQQRDAYGQQLKQYMSGQNPAPQQGVPDRWVPPMQTTMPQYYNEMAGPNGWDASLGANPRMQYDGAARPNGWDAMQTGVQSYGAGQVAPSVEYNYQPSGDGRFYTYPPGMEAPVDAMQYSSPTPLGANDLRNLDQVGAQPMFGGSGSSSPYADPFAPGGAQGAADTKDALAAAKDIPLPWQINSDAYNQMTQYGKDMLWGAYEDQGYDKGLAQSLYQKSLPTTGGPQAGSYAK